MPSIQPVLTRQHTAALLAALADASVSPSRHSEEKHSQLNHMQYVEPIGTYGILETTDVRVRPFQFDIPTFYPSTIVESSNNLAL